MPSKAQYLIQIRQQIQQLSTAEKAVASQRYFPEDVQCAGINAADIKQIVIDFQNNNSALNADDMLLITEYLLKKAEYNEEVLIAFGLINKFVKRHYDDSLLTRFEYWLEHYASNWSHVDDLCIKTIYQFFLSRPHLIEQTQHWAYSKVSWCRRASNVVWVKFVQRKIGREVYCLDKKLIFNNCQLLISDKDDFVQKSVGWLLKVTAQYYEAEVIEFIHCHYKQMTRPTLRYAIEKMSQEKRQALLSLLR